MIRGGNSRLRVFCRAGCLHCLDWLGIEIIELIKSERPQKIDKCHSIKCSPTLVTTRPKSMLKSTKQNSESRILVSFKTMNPSVSFL